MPYSGPDDPKLPDRIKQKRKSAREQWVAIWNDVYSTCVSEGGSVDKCEGIAFQSANGVIENTMPIKPSLIILAADSNGLVKERVHTDGRKYLVAPTIAIVQGVMNETLYLGEEIDAYIGAWNGRPLIIDHPEENGEFISANSPDLLPKVVGFYFNAAYEDDRLKGEWWLDIEKAQKTPLGMQVLSALQSGKILEQSTGLFADLESNAGVYNGKPYKWIARNIRPDHVAILPHEEGACSVADGCGTPRVNKNMPTGEECPLSANQDNPQNIVFELKSVAETLKTVSGGFKKFISKLPLFNVEDNQMSREELIAWILENSPLPMTQAMLDAASDEELQMIADNIVPAAAPAALEAQGEGDPATTNDEGRKFTVPSAAAPATPPPANQPTQGQPVNPAAGEVGPEQEVSGFLATLPKQVSDIIKGLIDLGGMGEVTNLIQQAREAQLSQFDALADVLVANGGYKKDDLKGLPITLLAQMVGNLKQADAFMPPPQPDGPFYGGRFFGANVSHNNNSEWMPYEVGEGGQ